MSNVGPQPSASMPIESLEALATLVLALSAANERFIELIKNLKPQWFATEKTVADGVLDPVADRHRQVRVQVLSIVSAIVVAGAIAAPEGRWWGWQLPIGSAPDVRHVSVFVLGVLT